MKSKAKTYAASNCLVKNAKSRDDVQPKLNNKLYDDTNNYWPRVLLCKKYIDKNKRIYQVKNIQNDVDAPKTIIIQFIGQKWSNL